MPYIICDAMPATIGVGRTAIASYRSDDLCNWVAEVAEVREGETEIDADAYAAAVAANNAHNAAIPEPEPPTPIRAADFKQAAFGYLGGAAFVMPLAGYIAPALDALNASNWALARQIIGAAAQGGALTGPQYAHLSQLLAEHGIPGA